MHNKALANKYSLSEDYIVVEDSYGETDKRKYILK